jgi:hypothetical protein
MSASDPVSNPSPDERTADYVAVPWGVDQTIFASDANKARGIYGNCFQAAIASYLERPLDSVPHISAFAQWMQALDLWATGEGYQVLSRDVAPPALVTDGVLHPDLPTKRIIVGGISPRDVMHVCVAEGGRIVWDPHPSRAGLLDVRTYWRITSFDDDAPSEASS